jgi:hypothetical protein
VEFLKDSNDKLEKHFIDNEINLKNEISELKKINEDLSINVNDDVKNKRILELETHLQKLIAQVNKYMYLRKIRQYVCIFMYVYLC